MTNVRKRAIKMYWKMAKKKCPFQTEEIVNGYLEGFIDCAEYLLLQNTELEKENANLKALRKYELNVSKLEIEKLEEENAELKDKLNNLSKVAEVRLANWQKYEKAYNETEELLDKQIEATYKLFEENKELKRQVEQKQHLADVRLEQSLENYKLFSDEQKARIDVDIALDDTTDQLTYAKTIIQDLLDNTDEYARQKAEDFLKEDK